MGRPFHFSGLRQPIGAEQFRMTVMADKNYLTLFMRVILSFFMYF